MSARKTRPIPLKKRLFIAEYPVDCNATQAAIRAGYSKKTAYSCGQRLLKDVEVAKRLAVLTEQRLAKVGLTVESVLEAIRRQVVGDIRALFDEVGNLKPISQLTEEEASLIAGFEIIKKNAEAGDGHIDTVHKVKLKDQSRYVEMAAKHFSLLEPDPSSTPRVNVEKLLILIQPKPPELA